MVWDDKIYSNSPGYVLGIHRVKARGIKKFNGVIFIQHGMMQTSETFVCRTPKKALAFILADAGYNINPNLTKKV